MSRLLQFIETRIPGRQSQQVRDGACLADAVLVGVVPAIGSSALTVLRHGLRALALPFDAVRSQYARAVQAGVLPNSILASRDLEITLGALERLMLGALARRV